MAADRPDVTGALGDLCRALEDAGATYMIFGGIAVIARGVPRHTDDLDATIWAEGVVLESLLATLARFGIQPRIPDALTFARQNQVLLLRHDASAVDIEITFGWLPFEGEALASAETLELGGVHARVARAEDLVIYKAVAWRDRDRSDVERLIALHGDEMDLDRVRRIVGEFAEALEAPERMSELEAVIERATRKAPSRR